MTINEKTPGDCGYMGFFNGKQIELYASSLYQAKVKATEHFKPRKSQAHMVSVIICERADGAVVLQSTC